MIITLCGSARFESEFHRWNEILTFEGHTVFTLSVFPSFKGEKSWYTTEQKIDLDAAHRRKIEASHAIFVIDRELGDEPYLIDPKTLPSYVGKSTMREIGHAMRLGKAVFSIVDLPPRA